MTNQTNKRKSLELEMCSQHLSYTIQIADKNFQPTIYFFKSNNALELFNYLLSDIPLSFWRKQEIIMNNLVKF